MSRIKERLKSFGDAFYSRKRYTTKSREPFFELAVPYLPSDKHSVMLDIGCGKGAFAEHLGLYDDYKGLYLLDGNPQTVQKHKANGVNALLYRAPESLPFDDGSVSLIHCSHMVEHLTHKELYAFLKEIDRVLQTEGVLVLSAPLFWVNFYKDLSHIKPYYPNVFTNYLCDHSKEPNPSAASVSQKFDVREQVYRYTTSDFGEWGANTFAMDLLVRLISSALKTAGLRKYTQSGFTLVLQKSKS